MAKRKKADVSFNFGANTDTGPRYASKPRAPRSTGGRRKLTAAQKAAAKLYMG
jgi:hypothetical protein